MSTKPLWKPAAMLFAGGLGLGWLSHGVAASHDPVSTPLAGSIAEHGTLAQAGPAGDTALRAVGLPPPPTSIRSASTGLARPLVACEDSDLDGHMAKLQPALEATIARAKTAGILSQASVGIVDLDGGGRLMLRADTEYFPASMLKLPLTMAWMRHAERQPSLLDQAVPFTMNDDGRQANQEAGALQRGNSYTPRDLLRRMLMHSRNDAKALLTLHLPEVELKSLYTELLLPWPYANVDHDAVITTRHMTRILEALYGATVLSKESAEQVLEMAASSDYHEGIDAKLPGGTKVAHKWGMRNVPGKKGNEATHMHDCGIVYKPGRPYLICVMSVGRVGWEQARVMADLSRIVWDSLP